MHKFPWILCYTFQNSKRFLVNSVDESKFCHTWRMRGWKVWKYGFYAYEFEFCNKQQLHHLLFSNNIVVILCEVLMFSITYRYKYLPLTKHANPIFAIKNLTTQTFPSVILTFFCLNVYLQVHKWKSCITFLKPLHSLVPVRG